MKELSLAIGGMHCGACVRRVSDALGKVQGVRVGAVEIGSARVQYDPAQASPAAIVAAVEKIGFSAAASE